MKFATYRLHPSAPDQLGVVHHDDTLLLPLFGRIAAPDMIALIRDYGVLKNSIAQAVATAPAAAWLPVASVMLLAPIPTPPRNIFCIGKNYRAHAEEFHNSGFDSSRGAAAIPDLPIVFTKAPSSVIGSGADIPAFLDETNSTDYEGELGVIIGTRARGIPAATALDHVFGYTIINDVTARNVQQAHRQWFLGKSIDGFCPMGPYLVTADAFTPHSAAKLATYVNDELRQQASFADLIFSVEQIIETLSKRITLEPGDVIATGTPEGVGIGFNPPKFLVPGDRVRIAIDGLGVLENGVAGAP